MELLIKNARLVDVSQDFTGDIYIKNGRIAALGESLDMDCKTIDGSGKTVIPGFVDMHVHFREPGFEYKEDIESGSRSAVKGGFTAVNLMGNTNPICSSMDIVNQVLDRGREVDLLDIHQSVSITRDFSGDDITHLDKIDENVVGIITDDGKGVLNNKIMLDAMIKAKEKDMVVMAHGEDEEITPFSFRLSENIETIRDIELAKFTGAKLHMAHVSTAESMQYIVEAKVQGYDNITCEVAPHHIYLTTEQSNYRVNPPIREQKDVDTILWAIENGYMDMIATDHAPHTAEDKENGAPGMVGLETAFAVSYTALVKSGRISLNRLTALMSANPAKLLGMKKGELKIGYDGDLVIVDLDRLKKVDSAEFESKGKNTPFDGMEFYGEIEKTIRKGRIVYSKEAS